MHVFNMFITAVCIIFQIKLRRPKTKSLYESSMFSVEFVDSVRLQETVKKTLDPGGYSLIWAI